MRKTLMILAAVAAIAPASAQEGDYRWLRKATTRCYVNEWTGFRECYGSRGQRVPYYNRYHHTPRYYDPTRVYGYTHREDDTRSGPRCLNVIMSAVGPEAYNLDKARETADSMLMEAIRARHGSRMMDLRNSEALTYECWRSATGNRASEKAADFGGAELHQCSVSARPCRGKVDIADTEDPATEATIRRLRAMGFDVKRTTPEDPAAPRAPRGIRRIFPKRD